MKSVEIRSVEANARKKRRRRDLRTAVLLTIGTIGVITVAAIAPNVLRLFKGSILRRLTYQTKSVLTRLKKKGEIEFVEQDGKYYARLTSKGENALAFEQQKMKLVGQKTQKWDRRYRLVIFDVPEKRRQTRDRLRYELREVGFLRIQDSAWLYPYACEEFISLLKANLHIGKDVLYAVIEEIEYDAWIRKHFRLPER